MTIPFRVIIDQKEMFGILCRSYIYKDVVFRLWIMKLSLVPLVKIYMLHPKCSSYSMQNNTFIHLKMYHRVFLPSLADENIILALCL